MKAIHLLNLFSLGLFISCDKQSPTITEPEPIRMRVLNDTGETIHKVKLIFSDTIQFINIGHKHSTEYMDMRFGTREVNYVIEMGDTTYTKIYRDATGFLKEANYTFLAYFTNVDSVKTFEYQLIKEF